MDPVTLAIGSAVIGGATSAVGSVMGGRERARAQAFESEEARRRSDEFRIAGAQAETRRREQLTSSLETIMAIRAGRGVGEGSPTALASTGGIVEDESRDVRTERLNYLTRSEQQRLASDMLRRQSRMSLLSGYFSALGDIAGTGFRIGTARLPNARAGA
jgi:hypothetical protein